MMWFKSLRWTLIVSGALIASFSGAIVISSGVIATSSWSQSGDALVISQSTYVNSLPACSNRTVNVRLNSGYKFKGCMQGDSAGVRVIRYTNQSGIPVIGISYPGEVDFSEIRGVCVYSQCAYSARHDVLLDSGTNRIYPQFAASLARQINPINGAAYYDFVASDLGVSVERSGPQAFNAVAVSNDGNWAVVEAYEYGLVRIDLTNFHQRRILPTGATYGVANDPVFELAVSNSGREVVATGYRTGLTMVTIDDYCGDILVSSSTKYLSHPSVNCKQVDLNPYGNFPQFTYAQSPSFSDDGSRFMVVVNMVSSRVGAVYSPSAIETINSDELSYLALGDSYVSGEGEVDDRHYLVGTNTDNNRCHVSNRSYPFLLSMPWNLGVTRSVACSGATIGGVLSGSSDIPSEDLPSILNDFTPGSISQLSFVGRYQPNVVTLGIGGNDVGLMSKLATCLGVGTCHWASDISMRAMVANEILQLESSVRQALSEIKKVSPSTTMKMVGYPRIIDQSSTASCSPLLSLLLSSEERIFMDESIKLINQTLRLAAESERVHFIDIEDSLVGNRLCEGGARAMNDIRFGDDIAPIAQLSSLKVFGAESFHPTPLGHELIKDYIIDRYPLYSDETCYRCDNEGASPVSSYWGFNVQLPRLIRAEIVKDEVYDPGDIVTVRLGAMQFSPNTIVRLELRSEPREIGLDSSDSIGSIGVQVEIPSDTTEGYHTLFAVGRSWSGEDVHYYQVVRISGEDLGASAEPRGEGATSGDNSPAAGITSPMAVHASVVGKVGTPTVLHTPLIATHITRNAYSGSKEHSESGVGVLGAKDLPVSAASAMSRSYDTEESQRIYLPVSIAISIIGASMWLYFRKRTAKRAVGEGRGV